MQSDPKELHLRLGSQLVYNALSPTPLVLLVKARQTPTHRICAETFEVSPATEVREETDPHGNRLCRLLLPVGTSTIRYDAIARVPAAAESFDVDVAAPDIARVPFEVIRYTLPSRYCDSDRLLDFAYGKFGSASGGLHRVQAICDWVHRNIEYRYGEGNPLLSASEVLAQGSGVCRDFAHLGIALCRTFNLPTRYVSGFLPDIGVPNPGVPMDFHAYLEVYAGGEWHVFDPRHNVPRIGRMPIAAGLDAVDGAFATAFGAANLERFDVWSYEIDPNKVALGDPVDVSGRMPALGRVS